MSTRKRVKAHQNLYKQIINWALRRLLVIARRVRLSSTGFVLPTVSMVMLVVVLLTTALLIRAFDRSTHATNFRANQAVLVAAAPAIDRAKAKIDALFDDPILPGATPSDVNLYNIVKTNSKYTFDDEIRLKLAQEFNNRVGIQGNTDVLENDETLTTAWKFPIDTDDNGKFDTFTLYGIYFRSPSRATTGKFNRPRNPLEARTSPMDEGLGRQCTNQLSTSTSLVGDSSWYKSSGKLKKSVFVFVATVPNTNRSDANYELYKGNKGFYGLEFQQDRSRIPLNNNAVWFQDDLEITPDIPFRLNGRVVTNANLLVGGHNASVQFYQVSSKYSCFYREENAKITVGGNVGTGNVADSADQTAVTVDLFSNYSNGNNPLSGEINSTHKSTTSTGGSLIAYNDAAYNQRIALMQQTALSASYCQEGGSPCSQTNPPQKSTVLAITQYPKDVKKGFTDRVQSSSLNTYDILAEEIEIYFRNRTRRVPYAEISSPDGTNANSPYDSDGDHVDTSVFSSSPLEPPTVWREPTDTNTNLTLDTDQLEATWPKQQRYDSKETLLGDRVLVGNNLPALWKDSDYVTGKQQQLDNNWTNPNNQPRYRTTQVNKLDLGISNRDDFWEEKAAANPNPFANVGGLRVITGAGIYRNQSATIAALSTPSFLHPPSLDGGGAIPYAPQLAGEGTATQYILVWSDAMPMSGANDTAPPDLRMRATAVYHYTQSSGINQSPIACVSSYYDPTNATTAKNKVSVDGGYGIDTVNGRSNNGVVYLAPYNATGRFSAIATHLTELKSQAKMMFPNGRIVNEPLQQALQKLSSTGAIADSTKPLNLSENSAIDTAICSLKILDGTIGTPSTVIPHGAIKEASFLDAREVKMLDKTASNYDLELEQRQPLEIRVTEINLSTDNTQGITRKTIGTSEYLLPNSGIIYVSRDDALPDTSNKSNAGKLLSPTDFILDSTRRPNGIRLINGSNLARRSDNAYQEEEKGLILATNLAVYIKGNFNLHRQPGGSADIEEFTDKLESDWSDFYTRAVIDSNYACRPGKIGCPTTNGDTWRATTIIADAVTLLSGSFQDGFRNQGDYDLRNNAGTSVTETRKQNGFWDNSFVTSALWWNTSNTDHAYPAESTNSYVSYLTNGVTPIQRRLDFPEYLMEYCPKVPVSACQMADWVINTSGAKATYAINQVFSIGTHQAGTTAQAASSPLQRYARRVAFKRKSDDTLELTQWSNGEVTPIPLGINTAGKIDQFPYDTYGTKAPRSADNALWFRTTSNTSGKPYNDANYGNHPLFYLDHAIATTQQPSLVPVLQIHTPEGAPASGLSISGSIDKWIQRTSTNTTFNAAFVSGNSPSQSNEESAGLHNFVRFLQKWDATANIKGSFIQLQRSAYATAPFAPIKADQVNVNNGSLSIFAYSPTKYPVGGTPTGTLTYYSAPTRQWSFDVGLLSQSPDLFAQTFTQPVVPPKEFFREISRDDPWVQTLLCAAEASDRIGAPGATYTQYTVPNKNQRPAGCQSDTANYPANPS